MDTEQLVMADVAKTPKEEAEVLMDQGLRFAHKMLEEHGEFFPFGVAMKSDGTVEYVGVRDGREIPPSRDVLDKMLSAFRESALLGRYRAIGAFVDVKIGRPGGGEKTDAVQVCLEHADGFFADVFAPYKLVNGVPVFEPRFAQRRTPQVFARGVE